jgi:polyphosphate:AMP phosphotransferase
MFEVAELGQKVDREEYVREEARLRSQLLDHQYEVLRLRKFPVLILIGGVDGAGKGETVNLLNAWMDPRHIQTHAFGDASDEEVERPAMWRFWRNLPPKGKIGIFFGHWYTAPIVDHVYHKSSIEELEQQIERINRFEKMLVDEGMLLLKFWFHLSKPAQKRRLRALEADPRTRWRVTKSDWRHFRRYDEFRRVSAHTLRKSSSAGAPWFVVEGADPYFRSLSVGRTIDSGIRERIETESAPRAGSPPRAAVGAVAEPTEPTAEQPNVLSALDYTRTLAKKAYDKQLETHQGRLNRLTRRRRFSERSLILVFEGSDAAGKGGTIRRITGALDARQYQIIPIAAPTEEERAQPYLWRFWRQLPRKGRVTIFDRSWYGRVLVERVEGFCSAGAWSRAFEEINDFEEQLIDSGALVMKFWLTISQEEQLRRFKEREETPWKRFKITEEDWRNRQKWPEYERAVCEMVERTSTDIAPWALVPAADKFRARIDVLKEICERIEAAFVE